MKFFNTIICLFLFSSSCFSQWVTEGSNLTTESNIGIGISVPQKKTHVVGDLLISSSNSTADTIHHSLLFSAENTSFNAGISSYRGSYSDRIGILFSTSKNAEVLYMDPAGRIGIGNMSPHEKLDILDGNLIFSSTELDAESPTKEIQFSSPQYPSMYSSISGYTGNYNYRLGLLFRTNNGVDDPINAMLIAPSGRIGLGTMEPSEKVHIKDASLLVENGNIKVSSSSFEQYTSGNGIDFISDHSSKNFYSSITSYNGKFNSRVGMVFTSTWENVRTDAMHIDPYGRIGMGTENFNEKLQVNGSALFIGRDLASQNISYLSNSSALLLGRNRSGESGEINFIVNQSSEVTGGFDFRTYDDQQKETTLMTLTGDGKLGIGALPGDWQLAVNGKVRAKEIKVETGWADFVFEKNYVLPTIEEVELYIKNNGHLKDIPSEIDVKNNGIYLGEMNVKLLQKIEELTLYIIAQNKSIQNFKITEEKIEKLEQDNEQLKQLITELLQLHNNDH